ncbi:MAG TPA: TRAP transporter TatT component family protein [Anaeromyxobacteraceae bacterium]|nr:TRAP transporter TatT component family protein [Anaeromyxobacteraceae bacterium]
MAGAGWLRRAAVSGAAARAMAIAAAIAGARCSPPVAPARQPAPAAPRALDDAGVRALLAEGDRAFVRREDPAALRAALEAYRRAAAARPGDPAVELALARAEGFRALAAGAPAEAKEASQASARAAERALRTLAPGWAEAIDHGDPAPAAAEKAGASGAEALYWLALGTMRVAQATGFAAVLAVKDAVLATMERAAALDGRVDAAGPDRALGAWRAALPSAAGGGAGRSAAHFDRARALFPDDQLSRVAQAESYAVLVQDAALFDRLLGEAQAFDPSRWPERVPENRIAQARARDLAARRARLF